MVKFGRSCAIFRSYLLFAFAIIYYVDCSEYGVPIEIKLWDSQRSPLSHMVDVTNEFGLKILAEHNFLNENNIAFSPYGLMGILVALYEGVDGESSYQLQRGLQLPWNRNVMRIGFRDIHRTLKTYFVPEEGFLAGLALNNENVTFNENYKKILRFYGFDLETEFSNSSSTNSTNNATSTVAPTSEAPSTNVSPITNSESASLTETTASKKEETTANPNVEDIDVRGKEGTTTNLPVSTITSGQIASTGSDSSTVTTIDATIAATSASTATTAAPSTNLASSIAQTNTVIPTTTAIPETVAPLTNAATLTTLAATTSDTPSTVLQTTSLSTETSISDQNDDSTTPISISSAQDTTVQTSTTVSSTQSTGTESTMPDTQSTNGMSTTTDATSTQSSTQSETTTESQRRKRSIIDFIYTNPPYVEDYVVYRSFDIGSPESETSVEPDKKFLVNGLRNIEVKYMKYDSMMEHAFLPHLEASALRLPLDSERYYLLVVLPMRRGPSELERLLSRMARESDLSDIYAALRPRRVRAAVPSFTVKGHVTLTTDLQKLGIRDVFEPRQRDFTPMTQQVGVYIRSIEQAVSVTIRKYQQDDLKNGYHTNPVYFAATYPFLYFVMDSNIHVALMAGKMVDPLNTRIL